MRLDRNAILGAALQSEDVEIPELDGVVTVRELTTREVYAINEMRNDGANIVDIMAAYFVFGVVDDNGRHLFKDGDRHKVVDQVSFSILNRVTSVVLRLSNLDDGDEGESPN